MEANGCQKRKPTTPHTESRVEFACSTKLQRYCTSMRWCGICASVRSRPFEADRQLTEFATLSGTLLNFSYATDRRDALTQCHNHFGITKTHCELERVQIGLTDVYSFQKLYRLVQANIKFLNKKIDINHHNSQHYFNKSSLNICFLIFWQFILFWYFYKYTKLERRLQE